jgi:hypothetical protein
LFNLGFHEELGWHSWYSDALWYGQSGDQILEGVFATVQTGCEAHPASNTVGTRSFLGVKQQGVALTTHPHLALRLKKA